jgi:enediyne polyketide synthase
MAVAGRGPIACDVEPLTYHSADVWRDLLGTDRQALSRQIVEQAGDDADAAATRVWTLIECLKKSGAAPDAPVVFGRACDDGWIVLRSGKQSILSWLMPARDGSAPLAVAILVDGRRGDDGSHGDAVTRLTRSEGSAAQNDVPDSIAR